MDFKDRVIISLHTELIMAYQKYIFILVSLYLCFEFHVTSADTDFCDKSKCKGPIKYYEDLKCTPIYASNDPCCPVRYNCDHLKGRSADKCYYNGHAYEINQPLKEEHAEPCDKGCLCLKRGNVAAFSCASVDCFKIPKPGCYLKESHTACCGGDEVCPQNGDKVAECISDGKTYLEGQRFTPSSDPTKTCICSKGYTGKAEEPFCKIVKPFSCKPELRGANQIYKNCPPVFLNYQNPATECHLSSRCQNSMDKILKPAGPTGSKHLQNSDATCKFGQLTLQIGEELNAATSYESVCVKCVCEVPPMLTCQRLPDSDCDVTVHPKFDNFKK